MISRVFPSNRRVQLVITHDTGMCAASGLVFVCSDSWILRTSIDSIDGINTSTRIRVGLGNVELKVSKTINIY